MNKIQKRIVVTGALIVILMGLIPPWTHTRSFRSADNRTKPAGYFLIFTPPSPERGAAAGVDLDFKRLLVQWIITGIATGMGFALAHTKSKKSSE
jgi:hypothetical protein